MLSQVKTRINDTQASLKKELEEEKHQAKSKLNNLFINFNSEMELDWGINKIILTAEQGSSNLSVGFRYIGSGGFSNWGPFINFSLYENYPWRLDLSTDLTGTYTDDHLVKFNIFKNTAKIVDSFYSERDKIHSFLNEAKKIIEKISFLERKIDIVNFFRENFQTFERNERIMEAWNTGIAKHEDNKEAYMNFKSFSGYVDKIVFSKNAGKETYNIEFYRESALTLNTDRVSEQNLMSIINTFYNY